jgi:proteasome accessory factor B
VSGREDQKARRLVNLTLALLDARRPMTVAEIASGVPGYGEADPSSAAFRRSFERDKEDLRRIGIDLEVSGSANDEVGYRIVGSQAQLPPIELDADETAALALAAHSWSLASMATLAERALVKVEASAGTTATPRLLVQPRLDGEGPALGDLLRAVTTRQEVRFSYVTAQGDRADRRLQPWGVVSWRRRWYVTGFDLEREAQRTFRISRVGDQAVDLVGGPAAFEAPADIDLRAQLEALTQEADEVVGTVAVRAGAGWGIRVAGVHLGVDDQGRDLFEVKCRDLWTRAGWVRSFAGDVVPVAPPALVDEVRAGWQRVAR